MMIFQSTQHTRFLSRNALQLPRSSLRRLSHDSRDVFFFFTNRISRTSSRDSSFTQKATELELRSSLALACFYRFLSGCWGVYVDFMRLGAVNLDFLRIPVIRQTLRQDTLIRRSPARPLLRSANRRQCFKLRRRLNISIPDPKHSDEVRIKSTFPVLFLRYSPKLRTVSAPATKTKLSLSPIAWKWKETIVLCNAFAI